MTAPLRHFLVEGRYLGAHPARKRVIHELLAPPVGYSFFCTECGKLWAECPVDGARFMVWARPCAEHKPTSFDVPGSLIMGWEPEFVSDFPPDVWARELRLHLQWASLVMPPPIASAAQALYDALSAPQQAVPLTTTTPLKETS